MDSSMHVSPPMRTIGRDLARGAIAGTAGLWAMDQVLSFLYNHEGPQVRRQESEARDGIPALEVAAQDLTQSFGVTLSDRQRQAGGTVLQWVTGIGGGMLYGALRGRVRGVTAGRGLLYGAAFSLVVDEGLTPVLGFAPGPMAFPWQTHARGFLGHLVYGAVADSALRFADAAT